MTDAKLDDTLPEMTVGRAVAIKLTHKYLHGQLDPFLTLRELRTLMYFMREAGEPQHAEDLHQIVTAITEYNRDDRVWFSQKAEAFLLLHSGATCVRINRVAKLIDGFESPLGLELLAEVYRATRHGAVHTFMDVVDHIRTFNQRFTKRQIGIAMHALVHNGWVDPRFLSAEEKRHE